MDRSPSKLEVAISLAVKCHEGQTDKGGLPYILHPLRVMLSMSSEQEMIVAVLHDVAEDNDGGWDEINRKGFDPEIIAAIDAVTRRSGETYDDFIKRIRPVELARKVKLADIADNLQPWRILNISDQQIARYVRAQGFLSPTQG